MKKASPVKRPKTVAPLPPTIDVLLNVDQVSLATARSPRELRSLRASGVFPQPDSPPGEVPKWRASTVQAWIQSRYSRGQRASPS